jgi:predicted AlkP superfamily pyrophosphatase or phosphodiesterase
VIRFIHVALDTEVPGGAGYIRYSREKAVRQDAIDDGFTVAVDIDAQGRPVGIELTSLDAYSFDLVDRAATKYGLAVPDLAHAALATA